MTPVYVHVRPGEAMPDLGPEPYLLLLVAEHSVEQGWRNDLSDTLVATGCQYFCAWGVDCSIWHDCVDGAVLQRFDFEEEPDEESVWTTWHENEPLEGAMWFAHHCASHPHVALKRSYILHLAESADAERMLARYDAAIHAPLDEEGNAPWERDS